MHTKDSNQVFHAAMTSTSRRKKSFSLSATEHACTLCGKYSVHQVQFQNLRDKERYLLPHHRLCKAHYVEAKRRLSDPKRTKLDVTPSTEPSPITCAYPQCSDTHRLITPSFEAADNIKAALPVEANQDQPFVLCPSHYHKFYRHFRVSPCAGCGATPKRGACFNRHSPDPVFISRVMSENVGFDVNLCEKYNICLNCYKSHLIIIKAAENERSNPENFLEELIPIWEFKYADAETDKVTRTLLHVVLYIAREFVSQRAVLLPNISKMFCQEYDQENIASDLHLEVSEGTITFTSKWLLSQLILHFQDHIKYKCSHRKFGTVLFHKGSDLLVSLSWALGRVHENTIHDPYTHNPPTNQLSVVMEAAHTINEKIHSEIANMERENSIHSPSGLNLGDLMNKSDPILQSFLEAVTRAKRDQIFSNRNTRSQPECQKVTTVFLKCLLMYCANSRTPTPLHILLSDTITFTSKWLLSQLILHFQDHIKYKCSHRKFGTVLFHKGSDLLVSLSWALGRVHENTIHDPYTHNPPTNQLSVVMEAAHTINERIHSEIANMERENSIHSPSGLNLGDLMNKSDPILQSFLEAVTRAKRDQIFSNRNTRSQPECHKRKLRQFFFKVLANVLCKLPYPYTIAHLAF